MDHPLTPTVNLKLRIPILCALLIPVVLAPRLTLGWRLLSCFMPMVLTGTFRVTRIHNGFLKTRLFLGFVPVSQNKCRATSVVAVETKYGGSEPGFGTFVFFGPVQYIFGWIFDFLIPAFGGPYELWIETAKGREFIVWQGYSQHHFERNVEVLQNQTGADLRPR